MALELLLDGVDIVPLSDGVTLLHDDSLSISMNGSSRSTMKFRVRSFDPYTINEGVPVSLSYDSARLFGGFVETITESSESSKGGASDLFWLDVDCTDHVMILERRTITTEYVIGEGTAIADVLDYIIANFLDGENITRGSATSGVALTATFTVKQQSVAQLLNDLSVQFQGSWRLDFFGELTFAPAASRPAAPFTLADADGNVLRNSLTIRRGLKGYRNRVVVLGGQTVSPIAIETYVGDSAAQHFDTFEVLLTKPQVFVNDVAMIVADSTTSEISDPYDWSFTPRRRGIDQDPGDSPLTGGDTLRIEYQKSSANSVFAEDKTAIAARAAISGASGRYDRVISIQELSTGNAQAFADGALALTADGPTRYLNFSTRTIGWEPGQLITSTLTKPASASGAFIITSVTIGSFRRTIQGGAIVTDFRYMVQANTGEPKPRDLGTVAKDSISSSVQNQYGPTSYGGSGGAGYVPLAFSLFEDVLNDSNPGAYVGVSLGTPAIVASAGQTVAVEVAFPRDPPTGQGLRFQLRIDNAEPRVVTADDTGDTIGDTAHGRLNGQRLRISSSGAVPGGLSAGVDYYVVNATTDDYQLEASIGGGFIDLTDAGSGVIVVTFPDSALGEEYESPDGKRTATEYILAGAQLDKGRVITIDVTQAGSVNPGSNGTVVLKYAPVG